MQYIKHGTTVWVQDKINNKLGHVHINYLNSEGFEKTE
jgi:hypothetical protein